MSKFVKMDLDEEIQNNSEDINYSFEKIGILQENRFEEKYVETVGFALFVEIGFTLLFIFAELPAVILQIPYQFLSLITTGISLGLGSLFHSIKSKIFRRKERLKNVSKAKTEKDRLEEIIRHKIAIKKAYNRIKAIDRMKYYNYNGKNVVVQEKNDSDAKRLLTDQELAELTLKKLYDKLDEKYQELDDLSVQQALNEEFSGVRTFTGLTDMYFEVLRLFVLALMADGIPVAILSRIGKVSSIVGATIGFYVILALIIGKNIYLFKKIKDYKNLFKKINSELKDKALTTRQKKDEEKTIKENIDKAISEVVEVLKSINYQNEYMEKLSTNDNRDEYVKAKSLTPLMDYSYENEEQEEKEKTKVLRR